MRRAVMVCSVVVVAAVAVGLLVTARRGLYGDYLSGNAAGKMPPAQWDDATLRRLLRDAVREVVVLQDKVGDLHRSTAFDMLANAQASVGDPEGAQATRALAVKASISKSARSYEGVKVRAFDLARANQPQEAERAFKHAVRIALDPQHAETPLGGPTPMFSVLADARGLADILSRAKAPEAAKEVLRHASAVVLDRARGQGESAPYPIREQVRIGDLAGARASLDALATVVDAMPDPVRRLHAMTHMVALRWLVGDKEIARELCKKALAFGRSLPPEVLKVSYPMRLPMLMLATVGEYDQAFRIVDEVPPALRSWAISQVVESIGRRAGIDPNGQEPPYDSTIDRDTARDSLRIAAKTNTTVKVEERLGDSSGDRYRNAMEIVRLQARLGDVEGARTTIEALAALPDTARAGSARAKALAELAVVEARAGRHDESKADFEAALVAADSLPKQAQEWHSPREKLTIHPRDEAIGAVVNALAELGETDRAIESAGRIDDPGRKADVLASAARVRNRLNDPVGALLLAKAPGHGFPAISPLIEIADGQARGGDRTAAQATLRFAFSEAKNYLEKNPQDPTIPPYREWQVIFDGQREPVGPDFAARQQASAAFELAKIRARLGDIVGAQAAVEGINNQRWREPQRDELLIAQFWSGDAPGAFAAAFQRTPQRERLIGIQKLCQEISRLKKTPGR